jgi:hypothetical protein
MLEDAISLNFSVACPTHPPVPASPIHLVHHRKIDARRNKPGIHSTDGVSFYNLHAAV